MTSGTSAPATSTLPYLPEVQGLRTLALFLVATCHIWFGRISGGVDVFLLVSAFLLTRSLVARASSGAFTRPFTTIVRRFARLLPLAVTTIILTLIAGWLLRPASTWFTMNWDGAASLFYVENFRLQAQGTDYYAANHDTASLFQHFWSLSVQGQIFLVWPLIHLTGEWLAKRRGLSLTRVLLWIFGAVFAASFIWSVTITALNQQFAYFDTLARAWEFAAGSLLALVMPRIRLGAAWRSVLGWLGVIGVISCGFVLPVGSTFPGFAALWPVVSAALVIVTAGAPTRFGADRLLSWSPMRSAGSYTYALYLVHWPMLVLALSVLHTQRLDFLAGALVLAGSFLLSVVLTRLIEMPLAAWLRRGSTVVSRLRASIAVVALLAIGATTVFGAEFARDAAAKAEAANTAAQLAPTTPPTTVSAPEGPDYPISELGMGAEAPDLGTVDPPLPPASEVPLQWADGDHWCPDFTFGRDSGEVCLETPAPDPAAPTVLFVGNSHTQQYSQLGITTAEIAGKPNVRMQAGPGCPFEPADTPDSADVCTSAWWHAGQYIAAHQPELVVLLGTHSRYDGGDDIAEGLPGWLTRMHEASPGTQFVVLRDNPRYAVSPYECAITNGWDAPECSHAYAPEDLSGYIAEVEAAGGIWVDLNPVLCPGGVCKPQLGGVVTWFDDNHITTAILASMAQHFANAISDEVVWWPKYIYAQPEK